jgi:hypothetical protein
VAAAQRQALARRRRCAGEAEAVYLTAGALMPAAVGVGL